MVIRIFVSMLLACLLSCTSTTKKEDSIPVSPTTTEVQPVPSASPVTSPTPVPTPTQAVVVYPDFNKPSTDSKGTVEPVIPLDPKATPSPKPSPSATPTQQPISTSTPSPQAGEVANTKFVTTVIGGTEAERSKMLRIAVNTERVVNSAKFRDRLLANKFGGKLGFFGSTASPESVYKRMLGGDEFNRGKTDNIWQYELHIVRLPNGVYGRMYWPKDPIYFNNLYLADRVESGLAGTYCHEKAHQLGYTHTSNYTSNRPYSVPYTVGTICAEVYKTMFGSKKLKQM